MEYAAALDFKKNISASMLGKKKGSSGFISFASGTRAAAFSLARDLNTSVNGVGVCEKNTGGYYIKVLTREGLRVDHAYLSQYYGIGGKDITVEQVGKIEFKNLRSLHRPPFPGVSAGHYKITTGTLGCFVTDDRNNVYILSNNHVLANTNKAFFADPVLQPGPIDGGNKKQDVIARLEYLVTLEHGKPNAMDAALAKVSAGLAINHAIGGKRKVTGTITPVHKQKVEKFGRTTGHTQGSITTRNLDLQVDYEGKLIDFEDQLEIKGVVKNGRRTMFCDGGDSGSLILERGSFKAVGLLFAGASDGTTFATPIEDVLSTFAVKIL